MKAIYFLIGLILITAELLLVYTLYSLFYPFKPVTFNRERFVVLTKEVKQGGNLIYNADVCKNMEIDTVIARSFVNEIVYSASSTISTLPKGCVNINVAVPVPAELPAGNYFLRSRFIYDINALRTVTVIHDSEEFEVIEQHEWNTK